MTRVKQSKIKGSTRLSLTDLSETHQEEFPTELLGGAGPLRSLPSMPRPEFAAIADTGFVCEAELSGKVSAQPVAADIVSRRQKQWIFSLSALCSVQPLRE